MRFSGGRAFTVAAALTASSGCVHNADVPNADLVVIGHVSTLGYEPLDELGMSGVTTARLTINRVLKGRAPSPVLTIKYIAHSDLPADLEIRFHLRRSKDGIYLVCRDPRVGRGFICHEPTIRPEARRIANVLRSELW